MATARDRKAWIQILELYHNEFPHLWDKSNCMYNNKNMRNDAYKVLTQIYRENFDMDASVDTLKKKLENMRTTYFRELKKVKESMRSGSDIYEPSLWYFEQLNFLANLYEPGGRYSSIDSRRSAPTDPLKTEDTPDSNSDNDYDQSTSQESTSKRVEHKKKQKITVFKKQEQGNTSKSQTMNTEDWEVMGRSIGLQLRDINKKQLTIASKLISDTIYFAKLNRLSEESHIEIGTPAVLTPLCTMCSAQVDD